MQNLCMQSSRDHVMELTRQRRMGGLSVCSNRALVHSTTAKAHHMAHVRTYPERRPGHGKIYPPRRTRQCAKPNLECCEQQGSRVTHLNQLLGLNVHIVLHCAYDAVLHVMQARRVHPAPAVSITPSHALTCQHTLPYEDISPVACIIHTRNCLELADTVLSQPKYRELS